MSFMLKKVNSRMYCLSKIRTLAVSSVMLVTFCHADAEICNLILFGYVSWGGNISKHHGRG